MCKLLLVLVARRGCPRKILGKPGRKDVSEQFSFQLVSDKFVAVTACLQSWHTRKSHKRLR